MDDPTSTVLQSTENIAGVAKMLHDNYRVLQHRSSKIRFTKLINNLEKKNDSDSEIREETGEEDFLSACRWQKNRTTKSKMFLVQWNYNGLLSHINEIKLLISKYNPQVFCIQETHLRLKQDPLIKFYKIFRLDFAGGERACRGTPILAHENFSPIPSIIRDSNLRVNAIAVKLPDLRNQSITIRNIYTPPNQLISLDYLENILSPLPKSFIITGDFNVHKPVWGSQTTNNRGNIIHNFLTLNDIFLINSNKNTHLNMSNGNFSAIDLTFCSPNIAHKLKWQPENDLIL